MKLVAWLAVASPMGEVNRRRFVECLRERIAATSTGSRRDHWAASLA
jgi:hypothetical protein